MIFWGNWRERFAAAFVVISIDYVSSILLPFAPRNDFYFAFCAAFNMAALLMLCSLKRSPLLVDMVLLTYMQMVLQFIGWLLYSLYCSEDFYNGSIHSIVILTYVRILIAGGYDGTRRHPARFVGWRALRGVFSLGEKQAHGVST